LCDAPAMRGVLTITTIGVAVVVGLTGCQSSSAPKGAGGSVPAASSVSTTLGVTVSMVKALPDKKLTPGAVNSAVTAAQVCSAGFLAKAAPVDTTRATAVIKKYGVADTASYELDHLVPISLGGSNAQANLWLQSHSAAAQKDGVENRLHNLVCAHKLALSSAQRIIRANWRSALSKYGTSTALTFSTKTKPMPAISLAAATTSAAPRTRAPTTKAASPSAPTTTVDDHGGATALCNDGTLSFSAHHQGTCSHHQGVAIWYR
jgi:hypothetical protein